MYGGSNWFWNRNVHTVLRFDGWVIKSTSVRWVKYVMNTGRIRNKKWEQYFDRYVSKKEFI